MMGSWKRIRELERKLTDAEALMQTINNTHASENHRLRKRLQELEYQENQRKLNVYLTSLENGGHRICRG